MCEKLAEMFVENTGTHFLDSGGAYGRAWQRNQQAMGERTPLEWLASVPQAQITDHQVQGNYKWIGVTINTYHFLEKCLSYDETLTEAFKAWCAKEDEYANHAGVIEAFVKAGCPAADVETDCHECDGACTFEGDDGEEIDCERCKGVGRVKDYAPLHSEGIDTPWGGQDGDGPVVGNTYNDENCLSQDFMYCAWAHNHTEYVAISIHGGCDARGGYTDFRIFEVTEEYGWSDYRRCSLYTKDITKTNSLHYMSWYSDDGGNHYYPSNDEPCLEDLPWIDARDFSCTDHRVKKGKRKGQLMNCVLLTHDKHYIYRAYLAWEGELYELEAGLF